MDKDRISARSVAEVRRAAAAFAQPIGEQGVLQLLTSFGPFIAACVAMYLVFPISYPLTLALAVPTGALLVRIFIIQHDCGHGSFFASRWANGLTGRLCSLVTLTPFANWGRQHGLHHAEWNNLDRKGGGADICSSCLTVRAYCALSHRRRLLYRLPRHPLVANVLLPPLVFVLLYRLPFDTPRAWARERRSVHRTNLALAAAFGALVVLFGWQEVLPAHPSAHHGGGLDRGRMAVLGAASFRDCALDGQGRLELRRRRAAGIVLVRPAALPALADRQHRLPPRPSSQPARAKLSPSRGTRGGARPAAYAYKTPQRPWRLARTMADAVGRGRRPTGALPRRREGVSLTTPSSTIGRRSAGALPAYSTSGLRHD